MEAKQTLSTLQAGRGIAATLLVFFHLNGSIFGQAKYFPDIFWQGFAFGHSGVQFFFVLSGFIIAYIHWNQVGQPVVRSRSCASASCAYTRCIGSYWP